MNKKLAIIGAGGHGKVVGEIAQLNNYESIDFFDDKENEINGYPFTISGNVNFLMKHLNDYDVFLINEGQFFEDLYDCVDSIVNKKKKKVYVCGLDGDYKRKKFGN